jgi:hypothetical protein
MTLLIRVCAVTSALLVSGCASGTPSWNFLPSSITSGANVSLTIESDPPGADASTSLGPSCRTPCMIPVPADRSFTVSYSLNGYLPQAIQVGPGTASGPGYDVAGAPSDGYSTPIPELTPNPVYAQLQRAPPPAPSRKGKGRAPKQPPQ